MTLWKWWGIACFAVVPSLWTWCIVWLCPVPLDEAEEKLLLFRQRAAVDTVIVGDSRVTLLGEASFAKRGWAFFNMSLDGISVEDTAMELKYAMLQGRIRRVIMGVSFEGMNESYPFEFSDYSTAGPLAAPEMVAFATVDDGTGPTRVQVPFMGRIAEEVLPIERAQPKLDELGFRLKGIVRPYLLPDGSRNLAPIEEMIRKGRFEFAGRHDAKNYFSRYDTEYYKTRCLAPHAKRLYEKMFRSLREAGIACVVFETGRTAAYQQLIDQDPLLSGLQREWRAFFASQSYGSVRFLDIAALRDCYREEDALDACHYLGTTADRLGNRLAEELCDLGQSLGAKPCSQEHEATTESKGDK